jgi:molybdenum cofactor cytidylyltransferase
MTVGVLLLAAGRSRRFGSDKRVATLASGSTILDTTINNILATQLPLKVCLREDDIHIAELLRSQDIAFLLCKASDNGMGATLSEGIASVLDWDGALIALADMPFISRETYSRVACALTSDTICLPTNDKGRGHPVGFGQKWFDDLQELEGDKGGLSIVKLYEDAVIEIPCDDMNLQNDIDLPEKLIAV